MKKILFVCTGNTCRSPMAEYVMKQKLKARGIKGVRVSSAGVRAEVGSPMSPNAKLALAEFGVKAGRFHARQLTEELLKSSNLVLVMTQAHKDALGGAKNVFTVAEFAGTGEVFDPYGGDLELYVRTRKQLDAACERILNTIL